MSSTVNDVERAEMMLSLGMNEAGEALSDEERAVLEQFVNDNQPALTVEGMANPEPPAGEIPSGPETHTMTVTPEAIQQMIASQLAQAGVSGGAPQSFEDALKRVDPRDSEAALAMFNWLADHGRLGIVGNLNGGGYLLHYTEPKGSTKAGYTPGATQGGRMVDQAVQQAKEAGAKPRKTGMCDQCWSAVEQLDDGSVVTDDDTKSAVCPSGGAHTFHG